MILIDDRENEKLIHKMLIRGGDANQSSDGISKVARLDSFVLEVSPEEALHATQELEEELNNL